MSNKKKRVYDSTSRKEAASMTRNRILEAARALFEKEGFESSTIEKIATIATVSPPTIYALFQSKRGILRALMDEALPFQQFEALVEEGKKEISVSARLAITAKISRQLYDAERFQVDIFRGVSVLGPEFKELEQERENRRYGRQEETVKRLFKEKALKAQLTLKKARDILWVFTGRDIYRMLVIEQNWTSDEYENWLTNALINQLT